MGAKRKLMPDWELRGFCRLAESVKGNLSDTLTRLLEEIATLKEELEFLGEYLSRDYEEPCYTVCYLVSGYG